MARKNTRITPRPPDDDGDFDPADLPPGPGDTSSWAWVERLYDINREVFERVSVVESRVDTMERALDQQDIPAMKEALVHLRNDVRILMDVKKRRDDYIEKVKTTTTSWVTVFVLGTLVALLGWGLIDWVKRAVEK